ncbi:amino acid ABC transporter permease [Peterkaempfera bronchialis]|uniref:Amino acid ABC transporter permease n=1 Tax=Peterkaempfera bronchialis TaxID=2126346 RepID=A0A345T169_9ACTN|nr:amino acid ABC transporter permease [Peterkaempfera bronchialis]AXI79724.1 amino acid ABC transporter permease [Peterkaempfera bronchialis]
MSSVSVLYDAPGPRARLRNRVIGVAATIGIAALIWLVIDRLAGHGQFSAAMWEPFQYTRTQERLLHGLQDTLLAFAFAAVLSLALGTLLAAGRLSDHRPVRWFSTAFVEFFRAMPLVIMIFALYQGLFSDAPMWALVIGLTLYNGSVQAEIFRAGINAVPRGQSEAAYALGMRKTQVMGTVLVPQAFRAMLPSVLSQLVVTLKDTSLGYIITYEELLYVGKLIAGTTSTPEGYPYVPVVMVIAPVYIGLCLALSGLAKWIEARGRRSRKGTPPTPAAGTPGAAGADPLGPAGAALAAAVPAPAAPEHDLGAVPRDARPEPPATKE